MSEGAVHLACGRVEDLLAQAPADGHWLSSAEARRLAGMATERRRGQFLAARWQARWLLAKVHGGTPRDWPLTAPVDAPPGVVDRPELFLSISHSGAWTACALAVEAVGLDLEAPQRRRDIGGLIALTCTPGEQALLAATADRTALFYEVWTVKEATLKRAGEWIAPARLQALEARHREEGEVRTWRGQDWFLALAAPTRRCSWWTDAPAALGRWTVCERSVAAAAAIQRQAAQA